MGEIIITEVLITILAVIMFLVLSVLISIPGNKRIDRVYGQKEKRKYKKPLLLIVLGVLIINLVILLIPRL